VSGAGENRDLPASHSICCSGATQSSSTDDKDYAAAGRADLDRKRHRIENQTPEQTQADRARHRQINQTLEQIEAHRVRQLRINQTPEQAEADRAVLSPKNADVDFINNKVIDRFPGEMQTYTSADSVLDQRAAALYPTEFLNALNLSGIPPHELKLKLNCPIMLMRNLNALGGLCNGTRMICRGFRSHVIEAEIISGSHIGQRVFLPRISLTTTDTDLPFQLRRRQFPIRVCFAMTINKSQT